MPNLLEIPGSAAMAHVGLDSSNVLSAGYDPRAMVMEVTFKRSHGSETYTYSQVPPGVFTDLCSAPSPGSYWNENKGRFSFVKGAVATAAASQPPRQSNGSRLSDGAICPEGP
jgi:hypothetical protein